MIIEDGVAKMPDRKAFAGSICTADRLVKNMVRLAGASLPDAVKMMTETPAEIMGMSERTGRIESGRSADVILFDEEIHIRLVVINGIIQYSEM